MKKLNNIDLYKLRVLAISSAPNTKYLAFGTPNTTKDTSSCLSNSKTFSMGE